MRTPTKPTSTVLLTGFGPFPGCAENPSAQYAEKLAKHALTIWPDIRIISHIFPTEWAAVISHHNELCHKYKPALMLHFGVSSSTRSLQIERYARNFASSGPDNAGSPGCSGPIRTGEPIRRQTNLPCYAILATLRKAGIKAQISTNAGSYLCNFLFYNSLAHAQSTGSDQLTGFIHIPGHLSPENNVRKQLTNMHKLHDSDTRQPNWRQFGWPRSSWSQLNWPQLMQAGLIFISHGLRKARLSQALPPAPVKLYKSPAYVQGQRLCKQDKAY